MAGADALMAHRVRVMRLYRHSLKQMMSWAIQRSLIYEEFKNIRAQFEKNMNVVSTAKEGLSEGKPRGGGSAPWLPFVLAFFRLVSRNERLRARPGCLLASRFRAGRNAHVAPFPSSLLTPFSSLSLSLSLVRLVFVHLWFTRPERPADLGRSRAPGGGG